MERPIPKGFSPTPLTLATVFYYLFLFGDYFMSQITIKYGITSSVPSSLAIGELAYSESAQKLYIGTVIDEKPAVVEVGGRTLVNGVSTLDETVKTIDGALTTAQGNVTAMLDIINGANGELGLISTVASHGERITAIEDQLGFDDKGATFDKDVTIVGNLVVKGSTTTVNSEETALKDPVIHLGEGTKANDGMDRGIAFTHFNKSGDVKTGFFGLDATDGKFAFIADATVNGNDYTGDAAVIKAHIEGSATSLKNAQVINLEGDATGTVSFNGTESKTLTVSVTGDTSAIAKSLVRRNVKGDAAFNAIQTVATSQMANIDGLVNSKQSTLTNYIINGGSF